MGGGGSKRLAALKRFGQNLTEAEKKVVNDCFDSISCSNESETFSQNQFNVRGRSLCLPHRVAFCLHTILQAYLDRLQLPLTNEFTSQLFQVLCSAGNSQVAFATFVSGVSLLLKGLNGASLHRLCGGSALTLVRFREHLLAFINVALQSKIALTVFPRVKEWTTSQATAVELSTYLTKSLIESSETADPSKPITPMELDRWLRSCPLGCQFVKLTIAYVFFHEAILPDPRAAPREIRAYIGMDGSENALLPLKTQHPLFREDFPSVLLDQCSWLFLNSCFPSHLKGKVYPLFSSVRHGQSFSTFCRQLLVKGPTLLVIRDTGGNVFGGFAADSWRYGPQFIGMGFLLSPPPHTHSHIHKLSASVFTTVPDHHMYIFGCYNVLLQGLCYI